MALIHNNFSPVSLVVLLAAAVVFLASPACSTSPKQVEHSRNNDIGFRVQLKHVDSGKNLTKFEQIRNGIERGRQRLQNMNAMALDAKSQDISSPVRSGGGISEFSVDMKIGTPPINISAIVDTGSDLIWTQCDKRKPTERLVNKRAQTVPLFNPYNSSSFSLMPCASKLCEALQLKTCGRGGCWYDYEYGDRSSTEGIMGFETLTFGAHSVQNVGFGCGKYKKDDGFNPWSALIGFGRGPLSFVSQQMVARFAYCASYTDDTKNGILLTGYLVNLIPKPHETMTTPLIRNPSLDTFYYLSLLGITIGGTRLSTEKALALADGNGGLIIDSGTTVTCLEKSVFDSVAKLFIDKIKLPVVDMSRTIGLPVCFILRKESNEFQVPDMSNEVEVPEVILHLYGANLKLPPENYMLVDTRNGLMCLAMVPTVGISIFGNYQQQNMWVIHDLVKETVSFVPV